MSDSQKPKFFASRAWFRKWLTRNHAKASELWVGFYNKQSGKRGISYLEALEEALCFGWIDGVRHKLDEVSYANRFSPRKAKSNWSRVNIARVRKLERAGLMTPAGNAAFAARERSRTLNSEVTHFNTAQIEKFRTNERAWEFFRAQAPWYQRTATRWVLSAKKDETRARRLVTLIQCSAKQLRVPPLVNKAAESKTRRATK